MTEAIAIFNIRFGEVSFGWATPKQRYFITYQLPGGEINYSNIPSTCEEVAILISQSLGDYTGKVRVYSELGPLDIRDKRIRVGETILGDITRIINSNKPELEFVD